MTEGCKERLSEHVENIFKQYTTPGIHICDIATGGGKSYTIGKLTCEYYPTKFDRIIILCVQNKLVNGMNSEIERFINKESSKVTPKDKLVIENNPEVIIKAIKNHSFSSLLKEMENQIEILNGDIARINDLRYKYNRICKIYEGIQGLVTTYEDNDNNDFIYQQIEQGESGLRWYVRLFFENYKNHLERSGKYKRVPISAIKKTFPSLVKVYPQVEFDEKRILLMTVHKAMYGIDPIIREKIKITDFSKKNKHTLIIFDESDQAALAMRSSIIDQSIEETEGNKKFAKGYNGYLQYLSLLENPGHIADKYYGSALEKSIRSSQATIKNKWEKVFGTIEPYKSIFLTEDETLENYRRGVFFSGPILKINITQGNDKTNSYICYKEGERQLTLVHTTKENLDSEKEKYTVVVPLDKFLSLIKGNITTVQSKFRSVISAAFDESKRRFEEAYSDKKTFMGYPLLKNEIHTFFSRFETASEKLFEQQMTSFFTNRKNFVITKDNLKLPDYSVYSQGVQLYQEEIDELDNQHRVRLSCREINDTPEKILLDLVHFDNNTVVLCSATASCKSVVSNFDITYLEQTLKDKVSYLPSTMRKDFDDLVAETYPDEHHIEIVKLEHYEYEDIRIKKPTLPDKYKRMFSEDAQREGLADNWFKTTLQQFINTNKERNDILFQFYRLFQFIEAYHWFISQNDVRSMIFFQNRTGESERNQYQTLSCLIDGSYKNMPSTFNIQIPHDWQNANIRISRDWDEVENDILTELSSNKDAKIMLISAYGSFKAGTNMQYEIPEGLSFISGDNWEKEGVKQKKDWDAIYLQSPTSYLMVNEDGSELTSEKSLYNAMLVLMMLHERECLSLNDVARWLYMAFTNNFFFNEEGVKKDKAAWAQTIIEQAVGRLCRTRNKPRTTYILFDESMIPYFDFANMDKSLTKEFKALAEYIKTNCMINSFASAEEIMRCNAANKVNRYLENMRSLALRYALPNDNNGDLIDDDVENGNGIEHQIQVAQVMNQSYKQMIIRKPVIESLDELTEEERYVTFAAKCYGDWKRNEDGSFSCYYDSQHNKICIKRKRNARTYISAKCAFRSSHEE